ncbi:MAG: hypothetical protein Q4D81_14600 [Eubacteriales bacterium]|nr:hypothetical protein [Eubacteriales bacterium]
MSNTFVTTIRFNLDRGEDRRALEYLQGEGRNQHGSYTQAIIAAVNGCCGKQTGQPTVEADPERAKEEAFLRRVEETVRRAIEESQIGSMASLMRLFQMAPAATVSAAAATQPEPPVEEEPEEDWSSADDFMSGF